MLEIGSSGFDERGWETGRWPLAPSYRAHPRLYQTGTGQTVSPASSRGVILTTEEVWDLWMRAAG
jgi:hypothetical protein